MSAINSVEKSGFAIYFTCIEGAREYASLGQTCKALHAISLSIPVIAKCSLPNRRYLIKQALLTDSRLTKAAFEVIRIKNAYLLGEDRIRSTQFVEKQFYLIFKALCNRLNVNEVDREFLNCVMDIKGLYKYFVSSMRQKVYKDMIEAFTDQPVHEISIHNLVQKIRELCFLVEVNHSVQVEAHLRESLKLKKGRGFFEYAKKLQNAFPKTAIAKMETHLRNGFEAERAKIKKELKTLDAFSGCLGSVEEARSKMQSASNEREAAHSAFVLVCGEIGSFSVDNFHFRSSSPEIQAAAVKLIFANKCFSIARDHFDRLHARREALRSELLLIEHELDDVQEIVQNHMSRLVRFYFELDRDVNDPNIWARHQAFERIINSQKTSLLPPPH